jgi:cobalamin biosynthesis protein CbiD
MKTIKQELQTAIQNIADNYGVCLGDISIKWIDATGMDNDKFIVNRLDINCASIINPCNEN